MNAPKKIWFTPDEELASAGKLDDDDIPYIREDLVLELVEALKNCLEFNGYYFDTDHALAALAKLEESHE